LWHAFLKVAGINLLKRRLVTDDPEHPDVNALVMLYSLDSNIYRTLNAASLTKD